VAGRHSAARVSRGLAAEVGMQAAAQALAVGNVTGANAVLSLLGAGVTYGVVLPFSRGQELEADALGVQYMAKAGYDPAESIEFWQRMAQQGGERPPDFASTHPAPETRIAQLEQLARKWRPVYQENT
jgi:predicted Zn-dependent protease